MRPVPSPSCARVGSGSRRAGTRRTLPGRARQTGWESAFTLVEVLVALLILQIGVLAALGTLVLASRTLYRAERLERATGHAEALLDSLGGDAHPDTAVRELDDVRLEWRIGVTGDVAIEAFDEQDGLLLDLRSTVPIP